MCLEGHRPAPPQRRNRALFYYITDRRQFPGSSDQQKDALLRKIEECTRAGVDYIQLREKDLTSRELEQLAAAAVKAIPPASKTKLLINGRADIALSVGAHGVHLPSGDLPASEVRAVFARAGQANAIVGVSTHSLQEVSLAEAHGADFVVFGPVFEKDGRRSAAGLEQLRLACSRPDAAGSPISVLALGGVTPENLSQCLEAGAAGVAGIRLFQGHSPDLLTAVTSNFQGRTAVL